MKRLTEAVEAKDVVEAGEAELRLKSESYLYTGTSPNGAWAALGRPTYLTRIYQMQRCDPVPLPCPLPVTLSLACDPVPCL